MMTQAGAGLPFFQVFATRKEFNEIPEMTDPLGKSWRQPVDIRSAPMDETHVMLTAKQMAQLRHYDSSYPSGCYDGKCWLREGEDCTWLCWYHPHPAPGKIGIGSRIVLEI